MIAIAGAGAFGTALAIAMSQSGAAVTLWGRDAAGIRVLQTDRENRRHLPGAAFPASLRLTAQLRDLSAADVILLAIPAQHIGSFAAENAALLDGKPLVSCAKGLDLTSLQSPATLLAAACPGSAIAVLTGPGFAADIARGLPTALTLACADAVVGRALQQLLSTPALRLYRTDDVTGAELGGALKNVIAIAAGIVIGAGLGESARAALMTRGQAEMTRLALALGARAETLAGLSGFGDLVLTCTSEQSRNFRFGRALGAGAEPDPGKTVEGAATAHATAALARKLQVEMPISAMVAAVLDAKVTVRDAATALLSRPLKQE